jgi:hypothetical protein
MVKGAFERVLIGAVCAGAFLLVGCAPDVVFVSDEYFSELVVDERFEAEVGSLGDRGDSRIDIVTVGPENDFQPPTLRAAPDCYLFSPILRDIGVEYALGTEVPVFVLGPVSSPVPANVVTLVYDRADAFYNAGVHGAALYDAAEDNPALGALVLTSDQARRDEYDAFVRGFGHDGKRRDLRARQFPRRPRREELRSAVREMTARGIALMLVALGEQNPFVLDLLAGQQMRVITEDARATGGFADQVVLSVERSVLEALELVVQGCEDPESATMTVAAELAELDAALEKNAKGSVE